MEWTPTEIILGLGFLLNLFVGIAGWIKGQSERQKLGAETALLYNNIADSAANREKELRKDMEEQDKKIESQGKKIDAQQNVIDEQKKEIATLRELVDSKDRRIQELETLTGEQEKQIGKLQQEVADLKKK